MSFFCNTHYGGPVPLLGDEFEFAAAAVAWRGGPNHSPPFINPPSLNEWMMRTGLILTGVWWWWWCTPEKSSQEKNQEYWGWWGGSPGLSQWRHAKSKMYRTQTFLYITVCSVSISGTIQPTLGVIRGPLKTSNINHLECNFHVWNFNLAQTFILNEYDITGMSLSTVKSVLLYVVSFSHKALLMTASLSCL